MTLLVTFYRPVSVYTCRFTSGSKALLSPAYDEDGGGLFSYLNISLFKMDQDEEANRGLLVDIERMAEAVHERMVRQMFLVCYIDSDIFLGFCSSPRALGHQQITCLKRNPPHSNLLTSASTFSSQITSLSTCIRFILSLGDGSILLLNSASFQGPKYSAREHLAKTSGGRNLGGDFGERLHRFHAARREIDPRERFYSKAVRKVRNFA